MVESVVGVGVVTGYTMPDHDPKNAETWNKELTACPDCGGDVTYDVGGITSDGHGSAQAVIACEDCSFQATEEWSLDRTVRESGKDA